MVTRGGGHRSFARRVRKTHHMTDLVNDCFHIGVGPEDGNRRRVLVHELVHPRAPGGAGADRTGEDEVELAVARLDVRVVLQLEHVAIVARVHVVHL